MPCFVKTLLFTSCLNLVSGFFSAAGQIPSPVKADTAYRPGLLAQFFPLPTGGIRRVSDFRPARPGKVQTIGQVNISGSRGQLSPAGGRPFFLVLTGELAVPVSRPYRLFLESTDGAVLWLDGIRILSNDGLHPTARTGGSVELEAGFHPVEIRWFREGPAAESGLKLFWDYGTDSLECIPEEYFRVRAGSVRSGEKPKPASSAKNPAANPERASPGSFSDGVRLAEAAGCLVCHRLNRRENGPSFREVARRYAGKAAAVQLIRRVYHGSSGVWGSQPMPPQRRAGRKNIEKIVRWILHLPPAG